MKTIHAAGLAVLLLSFFGGRQVHAQGHANHPELGIGAHTGVMLNHDPWMHNAVHFGLASHGDRLEIEAGAEVGHHHYFDRDHSHSLTQVDDHEGEEEGHEDDHGSESHLEWGPILMVNLNLPKNWGLMLRSESHILPHIETMTSFGINYDFHFWELSVGGKVTALELRRDPIDRRIEAVNLYRGGYVMGIVPMGGHEGEEHKALLIEAALYSHTWADQHASVQRAAGLQFNVGIDFH